MLVLFLPLASHRVSDAEQPFVCETADIFALLTTSPTPAAVLAFSSQTLGREKLILVWVCVFQKLLNYSYKIVLLTDLGKRWELPHIPGSGILTQTTQIFKGASLEGKGH